MLIGLDFDNTLVRYDGLFHRAAVERGWLEPAAPAGKHAVREALRRRGQEPLWTELQGYVYGVLIEEAQPFPGVRDFFQKARRREVELCIISHKTRRPYRGADYDLRHAARQWLRAQGLVGRSDHGLTPERVFFEDTKEAKLRRIAETGCTHFVDDLPEFLAEPEFPAGVRPILFDPAERHADDARFLRFHDWREIARELLAGDDA